MTAWLAQELEAAKLENRKVIIINHVYVGVRYKDTAMWKDKFVSGYLDILRNFSD